VGDDSFGHEITRQLINRGVKTNLIIKDKIAHTGIGHVRVNQTGEYDTVVINGANSFLDIEQIDSLATPDLNVSYVLMNYEILSNVVSYAAEIFRKLGAKTIINLSPIADGVTYSISSADYLITNEDEARAVLRSTETDSRKLAELLRTKGAKNVIITKGSEGVFAIDCDGVETLLTREPVNVENTIGAGDTFLSIFAVALNAGSDFAHALAVANYAAAQVCTKRESFLGVSDLEIIAAKFNLTLPQHPEPLGTERFHD
jgi:ribokinase